MTFVSIQSQINLPVEKTWELYFSPEHIIHWNQASPDWHCPSAENDLRTGGHFKSRMEAKDGSFGFDFGGEYNEVVPHRRVVYTMGDGRRVEVDFSDASDDRTHLSIRFEPENQNPEDRQREGWQAILDSFKQYAESVGDGTGGDGTGGDGTNKPIVPSLWFSDNALEAMEYYAKVFGPHFPDSQMKDSAPTVVSARLAGVDFVGINGGAMPFSPNPSISFMVVCETRAAVDHLWAAFSEGGQVYMDLNSYPWSEYYGWIGDRYGFSWQLYLGKLDDVHQQAIVPTLMFTGDQDGRCGEAVEFYARLFPGFRSDGTMMHDEESMKGKIAHTQFVVNNTVLGAMDGGPAHDFVFNEAVSLTILCKDQTEIDYYWGQITAKGTEGRCGWCVDQFGVHWQVIPHNMKDLLFGASDPEKAVQAMMGMKKIVIAGLLA